MEYVFNPLIPIFIISVLIILISIAIKQNKINEFNKKYLQEQQEIRKEILNQLKEINKKIK